MKQHLFSSLKAVVSAACVSIFFAGCTANNPDSLGDGDETINVVTIESLNIQVKDINKSLNEYKTTMNLLSSYVVELQNKVNALDGQGYTDLKSKVDVLEGKVTAFENALKRLDGYTDLNTWVSNLNNGLNSLSTLQDAVNEAKTSITNITTRLNGLDQTTANIASEMNTKTKQLTDDLSKCSTNISGMMDRLAALENSVGTLQQEIAALISAVQSVVVVPDYADGSVKMTDGQNNVLRFEVYPTTAAQKLAEVGPSAFSLDCVETETKASIFTNIPITAVSYDGEVLSVTADGSGLKESIKDGTQPANARLRITDGKVTRSSEYFALTYKTSSIRVSSIVLEKTSLELIVGDVFILVPTIVPPNATAPKVQWSTSDVGVATVVDGKVTAIKEGTAKIVAYVDGKTAECDISVDYVHVSSIVISQSKATLDVGESINLSATLAPINVTYNKIEWASSNESVVTVSANGCVTAVGRGKATVSAKSDGQEAECEFIVLDDQYLIIQRASLQEGDTIAVNGESYLLERIDYLGSELGVRVPKSESYVVTYPVGMLSSGDHIARVKTSVSDVQGTETIQDQYFYGAIANHNGINVSNPAYVTMSPCLVGFKVQFDFSRYDSSYFGIPDISDISICPVAENEYLAGTASYVVNEVDKTLYPDLNPNIEFESAKRSITLRDTSEEQYCVTFPQTFSKGLLLSFNATGSWGHNTININLSLPSSDSYYIAGHIYSINLKMYSPEHVNVSMELNGFDDDHGTFEIGLDPDE